MTTEPPKKKQYRKKYLFPRTLGDVVKQATQPLMTKQGKLYGALLRDWAQIVGTERARVTKPERLQFTNRDSQEATLHLAVRPAAAPELAYVTEQIIEQCARYFGFRAITRIVLHANHHAFDTSEQSASEKPSAPAQLSTAKTQLPDDVPQEMRDVLSRMASRFGSTVAKKE